jgi:Ca2+-binding RTX toxin-like protein
MSTVEPNTATSDANAAGYWNVQPGSEQIDKMLDLQQAGRVEPAWRAATDDATLVDGNATNEGARTTRLTPDGKTIAIDPIASDRNVTIARERTIADSGGSGQYVSSDQLVFTTGAGNDEVKVTRNEDGSLALDANGERYRLELAPGQELTIRAGDGNDVIDVASDVEVNVIVDGGRGDDTIGTGAGNDRIDGGVGNDTISSGAGRDDVFGNSGNDRISAGIGDDVVYGGDGDDRLMGQDGNDFVDGGKGNDTVYGGAGNDILSGGLGDDRLEGHAGDDRIYAGAGTDVISNTSGNNVVYAQAGVDQVSAARGATNTVVNVDLTGTPGSIGVRVEGSDAFRQRVESDIEFLRSSPNGRQMLAEFDAAAARGNTVTIRELSNEENGYALSSGDEIDSRGRPGAGSDAEIRYNPSFHMDAFQAPVVVLFHEMSHAWNGVNGTFQPGNYNGPDAQDRQAGVPNSERQAVGLETTAKAYDFDGDPATPATTHNPDALSENGLRTELGLPLRLHYAL